MNLRNHSPIFGKLQSPGHSQMKRIVAEELIRILEIEAEQWRQAAAACNEVIPIVIGQKEKLKWLSREQSYLAQAEINRALIEVIRADSE